MSVKCSILERKKNKYDRLIILNKTRDITENDIDIHAKWETLHDWYNQIEFAPNVDWVDKAICSVLNSIVYQERVYFCIERENVRELLKNDNNWNKKIGLPNNEYGRLIAELIDRDYIRLYDSSKKPHIYEVCDKTILNMIKVESKEEQLSQVVEFINKNPKFNGNNITDGSTDGKTDVEKKKIRKKEKENNFNYNKTQLYTLEEFLVDNIEGNCFPNAETVISLAHEAVEKCHEFIKEENTSQTIIKNHLVSLLNKKATSKQNKKAEFIAEKFVTEAKKYKIKKNNKNKNIKEIKTSHATDSKTKTNKQNEEITKEEYQYHIRALVGSDKEIEKDIKRYAKKYEEAETEEEKYYIKTQIISMMDYLSYFN